jgi:hypothetical protein
MGSIGLILVCSRGTSKSKGKGGKKRHSGKGEVVRAHQIELVPVMPRRQLALALATGFAVNALLAVDMAWRMGMPINAGLLGCAGSRKLATFVRDSLKNTSQTHPFHDYAMIRTGFDTRTRDRASPL